MLSPLQFLQRDARHFQILFLGIFLIYGTLELQWDTEWIRYFTLKGTCLIVQTVFIEWKGMPWTALKSAAITGLGLCLLFHATSISTLVLAASIAISSKFLVRIKGKHVLNPANIGIVGALLLADDAWVSPGQWGSGPALVFLVAAAGLMVLLRVGRIDTSVAFLLTFSLLDLGRTVLYLGWGMDVWAHRLMNGSLLLFTFFMITDPMTTPNATKARIVWSILIAVITFAISTFAYIHTAPVWALAVLCSITPILDLAFKGERFSWLPGTNDNSSTGSTGTHGRSGVPSMTSSIIPIKP
ncbi:MAG: RnfABCDGE type electron transport complex subunit D [Flavobacteriales bacterium]|nr:RnfABCDGE type electron transport complex subunit D [Flavobacteriales bacterium]